MQPHIFGSSQGNYPALFANGIIKMINHSVPFYYPGFLHLLLIVGFRGFDEILHCLLGNILRNGFHAVQDNIREAP